MVDKLVKLRRELLLLKAPFAVRAARVQLSHQITSNNIVVVSGSKEYGALGQGKTTQIPQYLAELPCFEGKTVLCSQTSRLTARHVAATVAPLYNATERHNFVSARNPQKLTTTDTEILRTYFDDLYTVVRHRSRRDENAASVVLAGNHALTNLTAHTRIAYAAEADIFAAVRQSIERGRAARLGQAGEWAPHGTVGCFVLDSSHFTGATSADAERYQQGELGLDVMLYVARTAAAAGVKVVIITHSFDAEDVVERCTTPESGKPPHVVFQAPVLKHDNQYLSLRHGIMSQNTVSAATVPTINGWLRAAGNLEPFQNLLVFQPSSEAVEATQRALARPSIKQEMPKGDTFTVVAITDEDAVLRTVVGISSVSGTLIADSTANDVDGDDVAMREPRASHRAYAVYQNAGRAHHFVFLVSPLAASSLRFQSISAILSPFIEVHRTVDEESGVQVETAGAPTSAIVEHHQQLLFNCARYDNPKNITSIFQTTAHAVNLIKTKRPERLPLQGASLQLALLAFESVGVDVKTYEWLQRPTALSLATARDELDRLLTTDTQRVCSSSSRALTAKFSLALGLPPEHAALIVNGALIARTPVGLYVAVAMQFSALSSPLAAPVASGTKPSSQMIGDNGIGPDNDASIVLPSQPMPAVSTVGNEPGARCTLLANNRAACVPIDACVRAIAAWQSDRSVQARQRVCEDTGLSQAYMLSTDAWLTSLIDATHGFLTSNFAANGEANEMVARIARVIERPLPSATIACETTMAELMHRSVAEVFRPRLIHPFAAVLDNGERPTATHATYVSAKSHALLLDARPHVPNPVVGHAATQPVAVYNMGAVGVKGQWLLSPPALSLPAVNGVLSRQSRGQAVFVPMQPGILALMFPNTEAVTLLSKKLRCSLKLDAEGVMAFSDDAGVRESAHIELSKLTHEIGFQGLVDVSHFGIAAKSVALCGEGMDVRDVAFADEKTSVVLRGVPERYACSERVFNELFIEALELEHDVARITINGGKKAVHAPQQLEKPPKHKNSDNAVNVANNHCDDENASGDSSGDDGGDEEGEAAAVAEEHQAPDKVAALELDDGFDDEEMRRVIALSLETAKLAPRAREQFYTVTL